VIFWNLAPYCLLAILTAALFPGPAAATTKGLSQIVTPDIQPEGQLSLSFQAQSKEIANPYEFQAELGLTSWLEAAFFQGGLAPRTDLRHARQPDRPRAVPLELGLRQLSTKGQSPQPFLEAGYYTEHDKLMGGPIQVDDRTEFMAGWAHDFNPTWRAQLDFQSGADNFFTAGFTCNATERFQFNPAIYVSNDSPHRVYGYVVLTYTLSLGEGP
jgi:hypothetical protein